jgi:hypothetical protein
MSFIGTPTIGSQLPFSLTVSDPSTQQPTDADALPTYKVYEQGENTPLDQGEMSIVDDAGTVGFYRGVLDLSLDGYESNKTYSILITAAVGGITGQTTREFHVLPVLDVSTPDSTATLSDLATSPRRTTTDEGTVEERPAEDLIAMDRYLTQKDVTAPPYGMRVARTIPKGPVS